MGKKNKVKKKFGITHKDAFQRMNYLYQACFLILKDSLANLQLARVYAHTLKTISRRLVLKIDPAIKRSICKKCDTPLLTGITSTSRIRPRRDGHVVVRCLTCGSMRRYLSRSDFKLWSEQQENIVVPTASQMDT